MHAQEYTRFGTAIIMALGQAAHQPFARYLNKAARGTDPHVQAVSIQICARNSYRN